MKNIITISILFTLISFSNDAFSQLKVENDGSLYVNSYIGNWGRANWTKVHYQYSCAYHLWNTYYGGDVFYVKGNGKVWTRYGFLIASDSTFKTNIEDIGSSLDKVKNLRGVTYNRKYTVDSLISNENIIPSSGHGTNIKKTKLEAKEYGLIAQEVESVIPEAVVTMHDSTKAISYTSLIPVLIEAMKEQQAQIENLQAVVNSQEKELNKLKNCCENENNSKLKSSTTEDFNIENSSDNILFQNIPNPFSERTIISYFLTESTEKAVLNIYDMNGTQLKSIDLHQLGNGSVVINGGEFNPGIYLYVLIANGEQVDTKQMILTK
jgi:hypothetical protein